MQTTLTPPSEIVDQTKGEFLHYRDRLMHLLTFVPDDKLTWKASPSSRNALQIVGHCALTNSSIAMLIKNQLPSDRLEPQSFFAALEPQGELSREEVIRHIEDSSNELVSALETINGETIESTPNSPFGQLPITVWMRSTWRHLAGHVGQIEYLQTQWGDMDNHM